MSERQRKGVRKALREQVEVVQICTDAQVQAFRGLLAQTTGRIRAHGVRMVYPPAFFMGALRHMVPRGDALLLMAQAHGEPLAAHLYLVSRNRLTYYHGVSTRDRRLTPKQGPSALFWHALRLARERGFSELDMGGVNATEDRHDPQFGVTDFKRQWGTPLRDVEIGELVLSPARVAVQDRLLAPLWEHAHPFYTRLFARRGGLRPRLRSARAALAGVRPQKLGERGLSYLALRRRSDDLLECSLVRIDRHVVEGQEVDRGGGTRALVPVHERVILDDVEQVGACHLEEICVQVRSAERRGGLRDSRFQQPLVPQSRRPAVPCNLVLVDLEDVFDVEEGRIQGSVREPLEHSSVLPIRLLDCPPELLALLLIGQRELWMPVRHSI